MPSTPLRRLALIGSTIVIAAAGFATSTASVQAAVAAKDAVAPVKDARVPAKDALKDANAPTKDALRPVAKVKCVNKRTGLARYSRTGTCRSNEVRQVKPCAKGGACVIGDVGPGKGRVFYVAPTKQPWGRYLEAAPANWTTGGDQNVRWCSNGVDNLPGTDAAGIGAGKANTAAMAGACTEGPALLATAYRGGGKSDWYVPAVDELRQLFLRRAAVGTSGFQLHGYWSSTQADATNAFIQDFYPGYDPAPAPKQESFNYVRPIRQF